MGIRNFKPQNLDNAVDMSDVITPVCICGSNLFRTVVAFDDDTWELVMYSLDGECINCGTLVKLPTPLDKENNG